MESEPKGRDEQASEEREHERPSAAELSDRAAESVGRRYDATNEAVDEADAHGGTD